MVNNKLTWPIINSINLRVISYCFKEVFHVRNRNYFARGGFLSKKKEFHRNWRDSPGSE